MSENSVGTDQMDADADLIDVGPVAASNTVAEADALPDVDPGRKLGIIGIVAAILGPVGIALGFVAFRKSRAVGYGGTMGTVAMVAGTIVTVLLAIYFLMMATGMGFGGACEGRGPGLHTLDDGTRISCS